MDSAANDERASDQEKENIGMLVNATQFTSNKFPYLSRSFLKFPKTSYGERCTLKPFITYNYSFHRFAPLNKLKIEMDKITELYSVT